MSYVLARRIGGAAALGALAVLVAVLWTSSGVRSVVSDIERGLGTAWTRPCEIPVVATHGVWTSDGLRGATVYIWDGGELQWVGVVGGCRVASDGTLAAILVRPAREIGEELEALVYARRFTVPEILEFIVTSPETQREVADFFEAVSDGVLRELPHLVQVAWDAGLDRVMGELLARVVAELQSREHELEASTARILGRVVDVLQEPSIRQRWEPVVREEFTPVVKEVTKDAVKISWRDAQQFVRRLVEAVRRGDVDAWDAVAELIVARVGEAVQENAEGIRDALRRSVRRLVSDKELREVLVDGLEPTVREEFDRLADHLVAAVRGAFQDPDFREHVRSFLLNPDLQTEVAKVVDRFQDDAFELLNRVARPGGRLREEVALMAKVNALGQGLPVVIVRAKAGSNNGGQLAASGNR